MSDRSAWHEQVVGYADAINAFVERGLRLGWDAAGQEPTMDAIVPLVPAVLDALRQVNRDGATPAEHDAFRDAFPPAHLPLVPLLDANGQSIAALVILGDGSIVARLGAWYEDGATVRIVDDRVESIQDVTMFGACPNRRYFAKATDAGLAITDGWSGPEVARFAWPNPDRGLPVANDDASVPAADADRRRRPTMLLPTPDGRRLVLTEPSGVFVLSPDRVDRLLPTPTELAERAAAGIDVGWRLAMEHAAVSPDGRFIAAGCQDSRHYVFDAALAQVADIGTQSEYPHYAAFNRRGDQVIFNACHFYNGATIGVAVADLPGLRTESYAIDPRTPLLENGARVYAAVHRGDEYVVGDASGYLRAFGEDGSPRWQHFVGSTVTAMDLSRDESTLVVATCAGFVSVIRLEAGRAPWQIGTGNHRELRRWLFWKGEERPLLW